jgi:DNA segregation ATPase FtsK/SpoIIIE, S-DNA-T family
MAKRTARRPQKSPAKRRPAPAAKARSRTRSKSRKRSRLTRPHVPRVRLSELDQTTVDTIGLGLVACGLLLGFLLWTGSGAVGETVTEVFRFLVGGVAYLMPLFVVAAGVALAARDRIESPGRLRAGAVAIVLGLALGLAAGSLGLGPGGGADRVLWDVDGMMDRGGLAGEALYWTTSTLFSHAGAHLVFFFLLAAGALLLTGRRIGELVGGARAAVAHTRERLASEMQHARADAHGQASAFEEPEGEPRIEALHSEPAPDAVAAEGEALEGEEDPLAVVEREIQNRAPEPDTPAVDEDPSLLTPQGSRRSGVTESEGRRYRLPDPKLLKTSGKGAGPDTSNQDEIARLLVETLGHFGVEAKTVGRVTGPRVTRHELRLAPGTKVSRVTQLKDDIAYALASTDIRILAPIPGKQAVGVEVPNKLHRMVHLGDIFRRDLGEKGGGSGSPLSVWLGKDIAGNSVWTDLAKMPHLLVAGTTGSGKSGCVNTMLSSILLRSSPNEVRMVLVDPKRVELNYYEDIPHLLTPVVNVPRMAANVLANLIREMESRYEVMQKVRSRNIVELNRVRSAAGDPPLPYILCVIDELADLMMVAPAEVEDSIIRLAQKSRAVGIHLVLATQRPSVDIITGTIKVNVPARIAFAVSSQADSRVILDQGGAEALLGQGDMLFRPVGSSKLQRIQGAYITEDEVGRLTDAWRAQGEPDYEDELLEGRAETGDDAEGEFSPDQDDLLEEAIRLVAQTQTASVSMVQRRLRVGYTRAGRLIDMLERRGVISGYEGSKPRQVLITEADVSRVLDDRGGGAAPVATLPPGDASPDRD